MHDSVKACFRNKLALEHIIPVCNRKLAGQNECLPVVAVIYDLFKVMLYLAVKLDHPKVIDNQQIMCVQFAEEVCLPSFQMCKLQVLDEHVHREVQYLPAVPACPVTQGAGEVGLSGSCLSATNAENQQIVKQTPSFTPKNVKSGVFVLFKIIQPLHNKRVAILKESDEKRLIFIYPFSLIFQDFTSS